MNKGINNLLKYGSYSLVFFLPIIYFGQSMYYSYIASKTFLFYGLVEIMLAVWIYTVVVDSSYRLSKKNWLYFIPLGAYLGWMTLTGILGADPALSFWSSFGRETGLLTLYHCLALAIIISSLIQKNGIDYLHKLMRWFVYGGFILALSIWFGNEGFNVFHFLQDSSGGGLIGNSSLAAAYLLFVLAFGLFLLTVPTIGRTKKWWIGIMTAVILFSPIFINVYGLFTGHGLLGSARGATLGIMVMAGVSFLIYLFFSKKKIIRFIGIAGIVLGILFFSVGWAQLINPNTKLHQKFVQVASETRFIFWNAGQKALNEHPWFGFGPENYMIAFQQNFDPRIIITNNSKDFHGDETWTDRAHNIYYDVGVSGGYPAIALYAFYLLSILYVIYRAGRKEKISRLQTAILGGLIIGYVFQNLFVFDSLHSFVALFILTGSIFALPDVADNKKYNKVPINPSVKNITLIVLVVACATALIFFVYRPLQKDITYNNIAKMWINERPLHYMDLLKGPSMGDQSDPSGMADIIIAHYTENLVQIKNDEKLLPYVEKDLVGLSQYLEVVAKTNKTDARLYLSLTESYFSENYLADKPYDSVSAKHLFDLLSQAEKLSPMNPEVYWDIAQVYEWSGNVNDAEKEYQKAIDIGPTVPQSHQFLIKFAQAIGDKKLYSDALTQAQKDIPGFIFSN